MNKILNPQEIQELSFKIVREKFGPYLETKSEEERTVITRIAHAAADTEYAKSFIFHPESCKAGIDALKEGKNIITDVEMVRVGILSQGLALSGSK